MRLRGGCAGGNGRGGNDAAHYNASADTIEAPTTLHIEYPATYKDAPAAYKPVLDDLYKYEKSLRGGVSHWEIFNNLEWPLFGEPSSADLGYAVKDINDDGVPELLLGYNNFDRPVILSLFTLKENTPVNLEFFWSRHIGSLAVDGTIYISSSKAALSRQLLSYELEPNATSLSLLTEYTRDFSGSEDVFFEGADGERQVITEEEYNALHEQYSNPPNHMPLTFIPIEQ